MALEIPKTALEVENRAQTDVQRELPESNPRLKNSWLLALVTGFSNRVFDFYLQLLEAIKQNFPDTATGTFLEQWAGIFGKQRQAATQAAGNCVATGTAGSVVPLSTALDIAGQSYTTTSSATIALQSIGVVLPDGIVLSGTTATVTTINDHNLSNNVLVTITGADQSEYNLTDAAITVIGLDTFEYQIVGTPATPATGTILIGFTSASVPIQSDGFGIDQNLDAGELLQLQSPLAGVDDSLGVDFGTIGGGTDQELDVGLRDRLLERIQNPVAHFNESDIIDKAKEIAGVTRVFVEPSGTIIGIAEIDSITNDTDERVATAILTSPQVLNSGQLATITDSDITAYQVTDEPILVESGTKFHYLLDGNKTSSTIGAAVTSIVNGSGNVATVTLSSPLTSLSDVLFVTISGATPTGYNVVDALILVESTTVFHYIVPGSLGVATVFGSLTLELQQSASVGDSTFIIPLGTVQIYFMRDNDDNPIPSASEVSEVRDKILEILPANTDSNSDLGVFAPTAVPTDYVFTDLVPNTATMKSAIIENLKVFYAEKTFVGVNIDEDAYRAAIFNTIDTETGDVVLTFELSEPTVDITIDIGQIGTLGNVTFS